MTWGTYKLCLEASRPYVVLDLETTGLKASRHQIIELAALRITPGQRPSEFITRLVRPRRKLHPSIVGLTGINNELMAAEGVDAKMAISELIEFVGRDPIVSFNSTFDLGFLNAACEDHSIVVPRKGGHSCAMKLAKRAWPEMGCYRLSYLVDVFGRDASSNHRALPDALNAARIYRLAADTYRERLDFLKQRRDRERIFYFSTQDG